MKPLKLTSSSSFKQPESGTHVVTVVKVIELGTQPEDIIKSGQYAGKVVPAGPKVILYFELVDSPQDDSSPTVLLREYTLRLGERSNLGAVVRALLGLSDSQFTELVTTKGLTLSDLLGKSALASVEAGGKDKDGNSRAKITTLSKLMKGQVPTKHVSDLVLFDIDSPDIEVFESLPGFIKQKIEQSEENPVASASSKGSRELDL